MPDIKFLSYVSPEGLTLQQAQTILETLRTRIGMLKLFTDIDSFVEKTKVEWKQGADGNLVPVGTLVTECMEPSYLNAYTKNLEKLASARALEKWLENAIKYMTSVTTNYIVTITPDYDNIYDIYSQIIPKVDRYTCQLLFDMLPEPPVLEKIDDDTLTTDDYFTSLSSADLARYYAAQAAASTIGDFIHPDGSYSKARTDLVDKIANPCVIEAGSGVTTIYMRIPAFSTSEVDKMYFELQAQQRDSQKDVNSFKFKSEDAVTASERRYYEERQKIEAENQTKLAQYNDTVNSLIKHISEAASELRIAVPSKAKAILDELIPSTVYM